MSHFEPAQPDAITRTVREVDRSQARLIWGYHLMRHEPRPCSVAIGLGCHDIEVATIAAELYQSAMFPIIVFTGANSPSTSQAMPRGEAVQLREHAVTLGMPGDAAWVEPTATNTGENFTRSRRLIEESNLKVESVMVISMPFMERRAFATCRKVWPDVDVVCASEPVDFDEYVDARGSEAEIIDMMMGDLQRVIEYPRKGFAWGQFVPQDVMRAFQELRNAGFDRRLL
jgi:hypothetical protein